MFVFVNDKIDENGFQTVIEIGEFPNSIIEEFDEAGVKYKLGFGTCTILNEAEALKYFTRD